MKSLKLILILLLALVCAAQAAEVTLQWDPNDPTPDGYRVYRRVEADTYDYSNPAWQGTSTTCTIGDLEPNVTYYFVVRAFVTDDESGDSNEVEYAVTICFNLYDTNGTQVYSLTQGNYRLSDGTTFWEITVNKIVDDTAVIYHGNTKSHVFHAPSCRYYDCSTCTQEFDSVQSAIDAGYSPCGICKPER